MSWTKAKDGLPCDDEGEVLIFTGVIQQTSYSLFNEGMGDYWKSSHPDIEGEIFPVEPDDQWIYISDVQPPKPN